MNSQDIVRISLAVLFCTAASLLFLFNPDNVGAIGMAQAIFIDVGQGDSALLRDGNNFDVLIDGGDRSAGPTVVAVIREQSVDDIDIRMVSHAHADHIGGLIAVLEATDIAVDAIWYSGYPGDTLTWDDFLAAATARGLQPTPVTFPGEASWGDMTALILNPISGLSNPDQNQSSMVVLVQVGDIDFMFTGDIDATIEATLQARGTPLAAEILKVAHHGSAYSSSSAFLSEVGPDVAVISVGENSYGHPSEDTIERLTAVGADIYRTDQDGSIYIWTDGSTYIFEEPTPSSTPPATFTPTAETPVDMYFIFLPLILDMDSGIPQATPTSTSTPTPTSTPSLTPTATSTATPTPTSTSTATVTNTQNPNPTPVPDIEITYVFYDGVVPYVESDEYAEITNQGSGTVILSGWRLNAGDPGQDFWFPSYVMAPGESCRVYTNEIHPESCGFSYGSGKALWNNSGDCGYLYDDQGALASDYCY